MVNDNVQYHGEEVPVDLILSDFAEQSGFRLRNNLDIAYRQRELKPANGSFWQTRYSQVCLQVGKTG